MQKHIHVPEAIHNAARNLREKQGRGHISDVALANANRESAIRNGHQQAAAFWAEVVNFCKAKERIGPGLILTIEPYPLS